LSGYGLYGFPSCTAASRVNVSVGPHDGSVHRNLVLLQASLTSLRLGAFLASWNYHFSDFTGASSGSIATRIYDSYASHKWSQNRNCDFNRMTVDRCDEHIKLLEFLFQ
jgi:hypothetical protein